MAHKVRADEIKRALSKRHWDDFFLTEVKNGPTQTVRNHLKLDALAIKKSWTNPCITGYEVKVDRGDFTRDDKWMGYLPYCHQFSFVCPAGLIQPEELPSEVGLVYYNPDKKSLFTKRKPTYRMIEISADMLMYIIMNRLDNERHPFFSSQREFIEAYLADKDERKEIGRQFGIKLTEELQELRNEIRKYKREQEHWAEDVQVFRELRRILQEYGVRVDRWNHQWTEQLRSMLSGTGMNPRAIQAAKNIISNAETLAKLLEPETAAK